MPIDSDSEEIRAGVPVTVIKLPPTGSAQPNPGVRFLLVTPKGVNPSFDETAIDIPER